MDPIDPKSAHPFALERLTSGEWEELTFLLARAADMRVERLRAPDGGLDTILPRKGRTGEAERGWQAKHYPGDIHWAQCIESLDRAVELWKVEHVTFTFPKDLNRDERMKFSEKLEGRHDSVTVDFLAGSQIKAELTTSSSGERIARRFFAEDPAKIVERGMRAGGSLSSGKDVVDREFAIDEFVEVADPHFDWVLRKAAVGDPEPPRAEGAVLRLMFGRGQSRLFADAVPRSETAVKHYGPKVRVVTDDSDAGEQTRKLISELVAGEMLELAEGARLAIDRLPRPFNELLDDHDQQVVVVKAVPATDTWHARLEVDTEWGETALDLDLDPAEPSAHWVSRWHGSLAGLTVDVNTRWSVNEDQGQTNFAFGYRASTAPLAERLQALQLFAALHGKGTLRIIDRTSGRPPVEHLLVGRPLPLELQGLFMVVDALVWIERFSGRPAPAMPDTINGTEVNALAAIASVLKNGGQMVEMTEAKMQGDAGLVQELRRSGSDITIQEQAYVRVFGQDIHVGQRVMELPLMQVRHVVRMGPRGDDPWEVTLVPLNADVMEVWMDFQPANPEPKAD